MSRPVLGVIACNRMVGSEVAQAVMNRYIRAAMTYADVAALIIPSLPDLMTAAEVAPRIDGILLTGSPSNVATRLYGDEGGDGPFDDGRDEIAMSMVDRMIDARKPVFGICRGFQELNVALGGTLHQKLQEVPGLLDHREDYEQPLEVQYGLAHDLQLVPGGQFAQWAEGSLRLGVNSLHQQGIDRLAPALQAEAHAPDGVVEGVLVPGRRFVVGTQWHPEWRAMENPFSRALFGAFGEACRAAAAAKE